MGFTIIPSLLTSTVTLVPALNYGNSAMTPVTRRAKLLPHFLISALTLIPDLICVATNGC